MPKLKPTYFRNIIFGAEDSLVSTVGVLFGVATANPSKSLILLTGLLVISVEALSMGVGAYLSETSENELKHKYSNTPMFSGAFMFISYFLAGFIPLAPYLLVNVYYARFMSVVLSLLALFVLGFIPQSSIKAAVRMVAIAGAAICLGFIIAHLA